MLKNFRNTLIATTLAAALIAPAASFAQPMGQDKDDKPKAEKKEGKEGHPVIRQSIRQLENVKRELTTKAASDFGGHKAAAIKSIDEAIEHLKQALNFDKK